MDRPCWIGNVISAMTNQRCRIYPPDYFIPSRVRRVDGGIRLPFSHSTRVQTERQLVGQCRFIPLLYLARAVEEAYLLTCRTSHDILVLHPHDLIGMIKVQLSNRPTGTSTENWSKSMRDTVVGCTFKSVYNDNRLPSFQMGTRCHPIVVTSRYHTESEYGTRIEPKFKSCTVS
jgi:hypothetical protein